MSVGSAPAHVAIVGAGMVGLSAAWFLQERGVGVTVVDRTGVAAGSSWGNAGMLNPAFTLPLAEPSILRYGIASLFDRSSPVAIPPTVDRRLWAFLIAFARQCTNRRWERAMEVFTEVNRVSLDAYDQLSDAGVTAPVRDAAPFVAACGTDEDRRHLIEEFEKVAAAGGEVSYETVSGDELRALEPILSTENRTGVLVHGQRFINPPEMTHAMADAVQARGGTVRTGVEVTGVRDLGARGAELTCRNGEPIHADAVVLSTGAWLNGLARPFGVRTVVQAGRGYSFSVEPEDMPTHPIYLAGRRVACNPLGDRFRVTGMMEFRPADAKLDPRRVRTIIDAARPMFRGVDWTARRDEWVGSRPCTADGLPLVGTTRSPRVHVSGGHGMWGMVLGPLTGKLLAESVATGRTPPLMRHFDPLR
ncbi:FAD-dependent oxidoreductase [Streptomyces sp. AJS327]|uniref:NAD(P)/FAD-dependent oxidoreductase n=1 Tax=Streptomyces sp. AJS327 TaxID=2545265 RepID=UPI0015DF94A9|nr:FAD-dependent oxidoreductase [Streptomyces sp. AJS327]MBA0049934.1 FAD-dependent oxidoreductase [Streptomyces sp. AJS327]